MPLPILPPDRSPGGTNQCRICGNSATYEKGKGWVHSPYYIPANGHSVEPTDEPARPYMYP